MLRFNRIKEIFFVLESEKSSEDVMDESRMTRMDQWELLSPFSDDPRFTCSHLLDTWGHLVEHTGSSLLHPPFTHVLVFLYIGCCW